MAQLPITPATTTPITPTMPLNASINDSTVKTATFCHVCCGDGYKNLKAYKQVNPKVKIETLGLLNVKDRGLDKKYGFDLNDLHKYSIIIEDNGNIIKGAK